MVISKGGLYTTLTRGAGVVNQTSKKNNGGKVSHTLPYSYWIKHKGTVRFYNSYKNVWLKVDTK